MKKLGLLLFALSTTFVLLLGCGNNPSTNTNTVSVEKGLSQNGVADVTNGDVSLSEAIKMAQEFVKLNMIGEITFDNTQLKGCEAVSAVENRFKILQLFTLKDLSGNTGKYVYKTYVQYFGGNKEDLSNWEYGVLTIESEKTREQKIFRGDMKTREMIENSSGSYIANDITFDVIDSRPKNAIMLSYKGDLTRQQVVDALESLHKQLGYEKYMLCKYPEREDYMYMYGDYYGIWDYSQSKKFVYIYDNLEDFLHKRGGVAVDKD